MCYGCYAYGFRFDPHLADYCFVIFWQCLFCRQHADGNGLASAYVPPVQSLAETK